uniref:Carbonic anhydrase n=1 Tax=Exaiptasia diaphana TaxID=2652724 RepID=A0A1B0YD58_EXADI|nr:alpha carbonic anhydrase 9 [Exaiptasia diaphana]
MDGKPLNYHQVVKTCTLIYIEHSVDPSIASQGYIDMWVLYMMLSYWLVYFLFNDYVHASSDGHEWGYGETHDKVYGINDWGKISETCRDGKRQSPVNINTSKAKAGDSSSTDRLVSYDERHGKVTGDLVNNGHSPTFKVTNGNVIYTNPRNKAKYKLAQFHFHFGCKDSVGSEHTVDGKSYPGELHLVFFNTDFKEFNNAVTKPDGLTVIGVFMKKSKKASYQIRELARKIEKISNDDEDKPLKDVEVKLRWLVPGLTKSGCMEHYSYNGSLTTPGCHETVDWRVLKKPINANNFVLSQFRKLESKNSENGKMCDNFRPTQKLNRREIKLQK